MDGGSKGLLNSQLLTIGAGTLSPGTSYTFSMSVNGCSSTAYGNFTLEADVAPWGGTCGMVPSSGTELSTVFQLWCSDWVDIQDDTPVQYQFYVAYQAAGLAATDDDLIPLERPLGLSSPSASLLATLPAGQHAIVAYVSDVRGTSTRVVIRGVSDLLSVTPRSRRRLAEGHDGPVDAVESLLSLPVGVPGMSGPSRRSLATLTQLSSPQPSGTDAAEASTAQSDITNTMAPAISIQDYTTALQFAGSFGQMYGLNASTGPVASGCVVSYMIIPFESFVVNMQSIASAQISVTQTLLTQMLCPLADVTSEPRKLTYTASNTAAKIAASLMTGALADNTVSLDTSGYNCAMRLLGNLLSVVESQCYTVPGTRDEDLALATRTGLLQPLVQLMLRSVGSGTPMTLTTAASTGAFAATLSLQVQALTLTGQDTVTASADLSGLGGISVTGLLQPTSAMLAAQAAGSSVQLLVGAFQSMGASPLNSPALALIPDFARKNSSMIFLQAYGVSAPSPGQLAAASLTGGVILTSLNESSIGLSSATVTLSTPDSALSSPVANELLTVYAMPLDGSTGFSWVVPGTPTSSPVSTLNAGTSAGVISVASWGPTGKLASSYSTLALASGLSGGYSATAFSAYYQSSAPPPPPPSAPAVTPAPAPAKAAAAAAAATSPLPAAIGGAVGGGAVVGMIAAAVYYHRLRQRRKVSPLDGAKQGDDSDGELDPAVPWTQRAPSLTPFRLSRQAKPRTPRPRPSPHSPGSTSSVLGRTAGRTFPRMRRRSTRTSSGRSVATWPTGVVRTSSSTTSSPWPRRSWRCRRGTTT